MSNNSTPADGLDLWSLLPAEGDGSPPPAAGDALHNGPGPPPHNAGPVGVEDDHHAHTPAATSPHEGTGDWQGALHALCDALARSPLGAGDEDALRSLSAERIADRQRDLLPEIAWRVLALLDQIPERGAIRLTALRSFKEQEGTCDLCGDALADPQHFPPRCERCGIAARLALGYLSLLDLLSSGL